MELNVEEAEFKSISFLIDTASSFSLVKPSALHDDIQLHALNSPLTIKGVGGGKEISHYNVSLTIEGTISHTFFVVSDLFEINEGAVLGDDFFNKNNVVIDYRRKTLNFANLEFEMKRSADDFSEQTSVSSGDGEDSSEDGGSSSNEDKVFNRFHRVRHSSSESREKSSVDSGEESSSSDGTSDRTKLMKRFNNARHSAFESGAERDSGESNSSSEESKAGGASQKVDSSSSNSGKSFRKDDISKKCQVCKTGKNPVNDSGANQIRDISVPKRAKIINVRQVKTTKSKEKIDSLSQNLMFIRESKNVVTRYNNERDNQLKFLKAFKRKKKKLTLKSRIRFYPKSKFKSFLNNDKRFKIKMGRKKMVVHGDKLKTYHD